MKINIVSKILIIPCVVWFMFGVVMYLGDMGNDNVNFGDVIAPITIWLILSAIIETAKLLFNKIFKNK